MDVEQLRQDCSDHFAGIEERFNVVSGSIAVMHRRLMALEHPEMPPGEYITVPASLMHAIDAYMATPNDVVRMDLWDNVRREYDAWKASQS